MAATKQSQRLRKLRSISSSKWLKKSRKTILIMYTMVITVAIAKRAHRSTPGRRTGCGGINGVSLAQHTKFGTISCFLSLRFRSDSLPSPITGVRGYTIQNNNNNNNNTIIVVIIIRYYIRSRTARAGLSRIQLLLHRRRTRRSRRVIHFAETRRRRLFKYETARHTRTRHSVQVVVMRASCSTGIKKQ